jgi:uncharacterized membrane protein
MSYTALMYLHLATVLPAFALGTGMMLMTKGTPLHKALGKIYMVLMLSTGLITLAMPAKIGPTLLGHFGMLHGFSLLTLKAVPTAYLAARRGDIKKHRRNMIGLYVGGILLAGAFTLLPGRFLHHVLFG